MDGLVLSATEATRALNSALCVRRLLLFFLLMLLGSTCATPTLPLHNFPLGYAFRDYL
jgi:hypothetical protein